MTNLPNPDCPYFPCHEGADKNDFNCLFCYCPLYALGNDCGGNFCYTADGIKDCSFCLLPHTRGGYAYILENCKKVVEMVQKKQSGQENPE